MKPLTKLLELFAITIVIYNTPSLILGARNCYINWKIPSQEYKSEKEARRDLEQEKFRMDLKNIIVNIDFKPAKRTIRVENRGLIIGGSGTYCEKVSEKNYRIAFGNIAKNKTGLRHELYHIQEIENKKLSVKPTFWEYFFSEWRAQNYLLNNTF